MAEIKPGKRKATPSRGGRAKPVARATTHRSSTLPVGTPPEAAKSRSVRSKSVKVETARKQIPGETSIGLLILRDAGKRWGQFADAFFPSLGKWAARSAGLALAAYLAFVLGVIGHAFTTVSHFVARTAATVATSQVAKPTDPRLPKMIAADPK